MTPGLGRLVALFCSLAAVVIAVVVVWLIWFRPPRTVVHEHPQRPITVIESPLRLPKRVARKRTADARSPASTADRGHTSGQRTPTRRPASGAPSARSTPAPQRRASRTPIRRPKRSRPQRRPTPASPPSPPSSPPPVQPKPAVCVTAPAPVTITTPVAGVNTC